jgi:hypothetical protein
MVPPHLYMDACQCLRCTEDGPHNVLCEVHQDPPKACDCARGDVVPKSSLPVETS